MSVRSITALIAFVLVIAAAPVTAETFDYTNVWAHLTDTELHHFLYDCGGLVDVAVKGNYAYAVDDNSGLQVIDCDDPTAAELRGFLGLGEPRRCDIRDHYLYVLDEAPHLDIIDVDDQDSPTLVSQFDLGTPARDILVVGPWLYVASSDDNLRIYSLASATAPALVNTVSLPAQHADRLVLEGDRVIGAGDAGLVVLAAAVPEWPPILGMFAFGGDTRDLSVHGNLALVGQTAQSRLIDITDPEAMIETATLPGESTGVCLTSNGQAWIGWQDCWGQGGLRIHDVGDPTAPAWLHDEIIGFRGGPRAMLERDGLLYAGEWMCWCAGEWPGFHIFQLGDLPTPQPMAFREPNGGLGMLAHGSQVDLATWTGLKTWDLTDPRVPHLVRTLDEGRSFFRLAEDADLIVADTYPGLESFQVITRDAYGSLSLRGGFPLLERTVDLAVSGSRALVARRYSNGLYVVDVGDPDEPTILSELFAGEDILSVALQEHIAVIATYQHLRVFDLTDPLDPVLVTDMTHGPFWKYTDLEFVERLGRWWLIAGLNQGFNYDGGYVEIFDFSDPATPRLALRLKQLAMDNVGEPAWRDDLLVVPGTNHLTFYRCEDPDQPVEFLGRVPMFEGWPDGEARWAAVTPTSVATVSNNDALMVWPVPAGVLTAAPASEPVPEAVGLHAVAVPNPFNPRCELRVDVPVAGELTVEVFDARGRRVRRLGLDQVEVGRQIVRWNGRDGAGQRSPAGVYLARINIGGHTASIKLTLAK